MSITSLDISRSNPYLSIANHYGVDYGAILCLADETKDKDICLEDFLTNWHAREDVAANFSPRTAPAVLGFLDRFDEVPFLREVGAAMDNAADLREFMQEYGGVCGLAVKDDWYPGCDWKTVADKHLAARGLTTATDEIPF